MKKILIAIECFFSRKAARREENKKLLAAARKNLENLDVSRLQLVQAKKEVEASNTIPEVFKERYNKVVGRLIKDIDYYKPSLEGMIEMFDDLEKVDYDPGTIRRIKEVTETKNYYVSSEKERADNVKRFIES